MIKIILLKLWGRRKSRIQTLFFMRIWFQRSWQGTNFHGKKKMKLKYWRRAQHLTSLLSLAIYQATMYSFAYCANTSLIRSRLWFTFQKENMLPVTRGTKKNTVSDMSAADWLSQTHIKNYCKFSCVEIILCFFSHRWKSL